VSKIELVLKCLGLFFYSPLGCLSLVKLRFQGVYLFVNESDLLNYDCELSLFGLSSSLSTGCGILKGLDFLVNTVVINNVDNPGTKIGSGYGFTSHDFVIEPWFGKQWF